MPEVLPPDVQPGEAAKPYFEVLVVTPNDPRGRERARDQLRRLRRPEDAVGNILLTAWGPVIVALMR